MWILSEGNSINLRDPWSIKQTNKLHWPRCSLSLSPKSEMKPSKPVSRLLSLWSPHSSMFRSFRFHRTHDRSECIDGPVGRPFAARCRKLHGKHVRKAWCSQVYHLPFAHATGKKCRLAVGPSSTIERAADTRRETYRGKWAAQAESWMAGDSAFWQIALQMFRCLLFWVGMCKSAQSAMTSIENKVHLQATVGFISSTSNFYQQTQYQFFVYYTTVEASLHGFSGGTNRNLVFLIKRVIK